MVTKGVGLCVASQALFPWSHHTAGWGGSELARAYDVTATYSDIWAEKLSCDLVGSK
jgi:hypothetical protein